LGEGVRFFSFCISISEGLLCKTKYAVGSCEYCLAPSSSGMCSLISFTTTWMLWVVCILYPIFCWRKRIGFCFSHISHLKPYAYMLSLGLFSSSPNTQVSESKKNHFQSFVELLDTQSVSWLLCCILNVCCYEENLSMARGKPQ